MSWNWSRALMIVVGAALVAGCGGSEEGGRTPSSEGQGSGSAESGGADAKVRIALLPKLKGISYFTSCAVGAREAADELGNVELIYDGPTEADPKKQAEMIEQWIVDGIDVICVAPNAPDVVANAMKEAMAEGIKVITWDADGVADSRTYFVNQATEKAIGEGLVQAMINDLGEDAEGDVVIISSDPTTAAQNAWIEKMKPAIEKTKLNLATIKYPGESAANALADAQDVLKKYENLKGIFGISSVAFPGSAEAVEQANLTGKVLVTGLSTPNDMKKYVHSGSVKTVVLWNTVDLGYLTIYVAEALANGKLDPPGETGPSSFNAGRLGEMKIAGDNVLLGDIMVFNKDNIDQFDF